MHINNENKQYINIGSDKTTKAITNTFNIINNENLERPKTTTTPELINIVLELEQLKISSMKKQ